MIQRVDSEGYNAINLNEFVFLPENQEVDYTGRNYLSEMAYYYYYAPSEIRLTRIYKHNVDIDNMSSAGHTITGEGVRIYPTPMILRHYVALNLEKFKSTYTSRRFDQEELDKGWHHNRVGYRWDHVHIPELKKLIHAPSEGIVTSNPLKKHFWEW